MIHIEKKQQHSDLFLLFKSSREDRMEQLQPNRWLEQDWLHDEEKTWW